MPYLPRPTIDQTEFPLSYSADLMLAVRVIEERWRRHFPLLPYYSLRVAQSVPASDNATVGDGIEATALDPLWGESVGVDVEGQQWAQPHGYGTAPATDVDVFADPIPLNMRIQRDAEDTDLKRWGFDRARDLIAVVPVSFFDAAGVEARVGDKFVWNGEEFSVLQVTRDGYWRNTNLRLYLVMNAQHRRRGS